MPLIRPPPGAPRPHRDASEDSEDPLVHQMKMMRGEMRSSFAALERRVQGTAQGIERHPSDPPRGYTLPMTPTGRVLLDDVQNELDKLRRERADAERRATLDRELSRDALVAADVRLRRWTSILSVLIALAGVLGGLLNHLLGK